MEKIVFPTLLLLYATLAAAAELTTEARVTPQTLVVGLSPSISVDLTNTAGRSMAAPVSVALLFSPVDGGAPFFAKVGQNAIDSINLDWNDDIRVLAPGQSITLEFPATASIFQPGWFYDKHFDQPGSWRLQVALVPSGKKDWDFDEPASITHLAGELQARGYLSHPVTFTLTVPTGDDARVCSLASELANRAGCPMRTAMARPEFARRVAKDFPRSSYAPYALLSEPVGNDTVARIALLEHAIAQSGSSSIADWYRWLLAHEHQYASADYNTPADAMKAHAKAAVSIWQELSKSKHSALKKGAAKKLKEAAESSDEDDDESENPSEAHR